MAKADTFEMDKIHGYVSVKECAVCGEPSEYRAWYYPTFMNGDAEWCGDYCEEHKGVDLEKVCKGAITIRYKID